MLCRCLSFAIILLLTTGVGANPIARFYSLDTEDGLPSKSVRVITQDSQGIIWFGTTNGLARFDGYNIRTFSNQSSTPHSLSGNNIAAMQATADGALWIATYSNGLNRFDPITEEFQAYRNDPEDPLSLSSDQIFALSSDNHGGLWVGTANGLDRVDLESGKIIHFKHQEDDSASLPDNRISTLLHTKSDKLWVATANGVAIYVPTSGKFIPQKIAADKVNTLHESSDGLIWIGTNSGLFFHNPEKNTTQAYRDNNNELFFSKNSIYAINSDRDGSVWLGGGYSGLCQITTISTPICYRYDKGAIHSIRDNTILSITQDSSEQLWIGTYNGGVQKLDLPSLRLGLGDAGGNNSINCQEHQDVNAIYVENRTLHWLGTDKGLLRFDTISGDCQYYSHTSQQTGTLSYQQVYSVYRDHSGVLWVGTASGLNRLNELSNSLERVNNGLPSTVISYIQQDKNSNLFVAAGNKVYQLQKNSDQFSELKVNDDNLNGYVWSFLFDNEDNMWIGTAKGLATRPSGADYYDYIRVKGEPVVTNVVGAMYLDKNNNVWVGVDDTGLILFDQTGLEKARYSKEDGFPSLKFSYITKDNADQLWISTRLGIIKLNPTTEAVQTLQEKDGLQSNFFMQNSGYQTEDGKLYLGGNKGFNAFWPARIEANSTPPKIMLTHLYRFTEKVIPGKNYNGFVLPKPLSGVDELILTHNEIVFSIEFIGLHFADATRNSYAFKMEGIDPDWNYIDASSRKATYTNLAPGKYIFNVKSSNKDGIWNNQSTSIGVTILPPWWLTWWAYSIYLISAFIVIVIFVKKRTQVLQARAVLLQNTVDQRTKELVVEKSKVEQLLSRKNEEFANVSHEFRTPLTLVLGPLAQVLKTNKNPEEIKRLNIVQRNGYRLLRMVDQLLNLETFRVKSITQISSQASGKIIRLLAEAFFDLAKEKGIEFEIGEIAEINFKFTDDALERIVANLISNAIKYTPSNGKITVRSERTIGNELLIEIQDTGIGIPADKIDSIFERYSRVLDENSERITGAGIGLALVKDLVEAHDGSVLIESELGVGTTAKVLLPIVEEVDIGEVKNHANQEIIAMELMGISSHTANRPEELEKYSFGSGSDKPIVLVIEDNLDMRNYIVETIKDDFQVITAKDGAEGLTIAIAEVPDLIISDVMMPNKDGYQLTNELRQNAITNHIPIILLTARSDRESRLKGWYEKADEYLTKPFDAEELTIRLNNLLGIRNILKRRFAEFAFHPKFAKSEVINNSNDSTLEIENSCDHLQEKFIQQLNSVLELHYTDSTTSVAVIASDLAMSERQLFRKSKSIVDMSPIDYLRRFRIEKGRELLEQGKSASYATVEIGFTSQSYFGKFFKAQYGVSPSEFKKSRMNQH